MLSPLFPLSYCFHTRSSPQQHQRIIIRSSVGVHLCGNLFNRALQLFPLRNRPQPRKQLRTGLVYPVAAQRVYRAGSNLSCCQGKNALIRAKGPKQFSGKTRFYGNIIVCQLYRPPQTPETAFHRVTPAVTHRKQRVLSSRYPKQDNGCTANLIERGCFLDLLMTPVQKTAELLYALQKTWPLWSFEKRLPPL